MKLQSAFESDKHNPYYFSFLGVSIARAQQDWAQATEHCDRPVKLNSKEIQFHPNLAEVYSLAGLLEMSIHELDYALGLFGDDRRLKRARSTMEKPRSSLLPILARGHFLNRELGKPRHRLLTPFESIAPSRDSIISHLIGGHRGDRSGNIHFERSPPLAAQ